MGLDFIITIPQKQNYNQVNIRYNSTEIESTDNLEINFLHAKKTNPEIKEIKAENKRFFFAGDIIVPKNYKSNTDDYFKSVVNSFKPEKIKYLKGYFYLICLDEINKSISIYNGIFSILPIYYFLSKSHLIVSSRIDLIKKCNEAAFSLNYKFILEKTIFNYGLFNDTWFKEIKTVPANSFIQANISYQTIKHTDISEYFSLEPLKWEKEIKNIADLFLESVKDYFPEENFYISFTGGFDGRTIVSSALGQQLKFSTYSFGTFDSEDIIYPAKQCAELGFDFFPIILDSGYVNTHFYELSSELVKLTEGNASFARNHYLHAAKLLQEKTRYIITGNFGSEVLRSIHEAGVLTPPELLNFYEENDENAWIQNIKKSWKASYLNQNFFSKAYDELISDLKNLKQQYQSLPLNYRFYVLMYEEVIRKYFGPEIIAHRNYINPRAPFLDFNFIEGLLKTNLASVYSDFSEKNPLKRFKGQILYPHIIKQSYEPLLHYKTSKGYKPKDLLTFTGKLNLFRNLIEKRINKRQSIDCFAVNQLFLKYRQDHINSLKLIDIYNEKQVHQSLVKSDITTDNNHLINIFSINEYLQGS